VAPYREDGLMNVVTTPVVPDHPVTHSPEASRARILDAAEARFAHDGFDATPTARIAAEAGVGKGLLFYYFPTKLDLLLALLSERLPAAPLCDTTDLALVGDVAGSLVRLGRRLDLGRHESLVLRTIIFREASTHPEVREHIRALREGLLALTEHVLHEAGPTRLSPAQCRTAAHAFMAVLFDEANARRFGGPAPDLVGTARIIAAGIAARPATG
jgi:AcrR family transcriptional regulator